MSKFIAFILAAAISLIGWTNVQAAAPTHADQKEYVYSQLGIDTRDPESLYRFLGVVPDVNTFIVEPESVTAPNAQNWVWIIMRTNDAGTIGELSDAAFSIGAGLPSAGLNVCHRLSGNAVGGDTLFQSGFEDGMPFANGGVIPASWWRNVPVGSLDYQTDTVPVFGTIPEDVWVRCTVTFTTPQGVTTAKFTFVL